MYIVKVWVIWLFIVLLVNLVGLVGILDRFVLEIILVYENGIEVDIIMEGNCYILDDLLKFNNFFSVVNNGVFYVIVNNVGFVGIGKFIVYVMNVNFVEVNVIVVGSSSLVVKVVLYFDIFDDLEVIEFK